MVTKTRLKIFLGIAVVLAATFSSSWALAQGDCPSDMKEVRVGKAVSCIPEEENVTKAKDRLKNDPKFAEMLKGKWDFIRPEKAKAGTYCAAVFQTTDSMIWLMGPGGEYRGALLRFYGLNIPKPAKTDKEGVSRQKITLTQAPDPPQTLTVISHAYNEFKFGVLTVPVPSLEALVGAIADKQNMKIQIDGREVFNTTWSDGKKARDFLQKCGQGK